MGQLSMPIWGKKNGKTIRHASLKKPYKSINRDTILGNPAEASPDALTLADTKLND